ncbi:type II toxin-antitoxin system PemK/MazF family toxin [Geodermatophilus chilensis]|uniref:type II toxin-antitoxin system PemK/MazF family toxin n=1 Tax=Geodermatophilus chilensis TaxID=2035835 RepID=UPI0018E4BB3B|nr:type II toxin-antitoxin system PemK/MazF family toxin [Geodermatophilus chilensis]
MAGPSLPRVLRSLLRTVLRPAPPPPAAPRREAPSGGGVRDLPGGLDGVDLVHRPEDDGAPDPGEVVWAWVPYDEGDGRGKDRPVLVVGRRGADLVGLMLSSQDHDRDAADEARHGRRWMDVGRGGWDPRGRPSEVRLDRLLLVPTGSARREGAAIGRAVFDDVVTALRALHR